MKKIATLYLYSNVITYTIHSARLAETSKVLANPMETIMSVHFHIAVAAIVLGISAASPAAATEVANGLSTNGLSTNGLSTNGLSTNGLSTNGLSTNGLSTNGLSTNGLSTNGLSTNGLSTNGLSTNGLSTNGLSTNGRHVGSAGRLDLDAVVLPDGSLITLK
ncbi:MAG: hypothetical protein K0S56_3216 [Microvirga sp.]|jgi:hypothetical protein|nr:hypothetical protein [Microvirga sp.]